MSNPTISLVDLYAPIRDALAETERVFNTELVSDLDCVNSLGSRISRYRGKMLRPTLLLLSGKAAGELQPAHTVLAAVVEMVHMATLVHDDVLDGADERRRQPTVCATDGNVAAVLLGDYLISHAYHLCSSLSDQHAARRIAATTNTVCEGELLQNHLSGRDDVSEAQYFEIIRRKTGALTATCCELGVRYAGGSDDLERAGSEFGMAAGVAFQIIDDVLDVVGQRESVGKTLDLDFALGKLTLPTIHCLETAPPAVQAAIRAAVRGESPVDLARLRSWLEETGSILYAVERAREHVQDALRWLNVLPVGDARASLEAMASFIVERRF